MRLPLELLVGHRVERELLLYCVHGLLHCLGHDDHDEAGWRAMHAREDEIERTLDVLPAIVRKLADMSPYEKELSQMKTASS